MWRKYTLIYICTVYIHTHWYIYKIVCVFRAKQQWAVAVSGEIFIIDL